MTRFVWLNQKYTEWPEKSESQANDSICLIESEIYRMTREVWVSSKWLDLFDWIRNIQNDQRSLSLKLMTRFVWVNQKYTEWPEKSESQANDSICLSESEIYRMTREVWVSSKWLDLFDWIRNIQNDQRSLSLKQMTRFVWLNQKYTEWPEKSESQANDSICLIESEIYRMTREVWVSS